MTDLLGKSETKHIEKPNTKHLENKDTKKHREIEGDLKVYDEEIERYHEIEKSFCFQSKSGSVICE